MEGELKRCARDLVALSSLPAIWLKADRTQIAAGLAQLVVSILDADFACVILRNPDLEIVECHERNRDRPLDLARLRGKYRPNLAFDFDDPCHGYLRAMCVPIGLESGSEVIALCRRPAFPLDTEQMLLRVAANQAAVAIQRWGIEQRLLEKAQTLEWLNETGSALYGFTARLFHARSLNDIYEAGLDAILSILRCSRASILLYDDSGVMRFVSWRGLSEQYRRAVEGHSPWAPGDRDVSPICIDRIESADIPEDLKAVVKAEGIGALAFFPLLANGNLAGKFMAYFDVPHIFEAKEIDAAVAIARQLGFSLEQVRAEQARDLVVAELSHRVKNTLSTVISIARHSFTSASSDRQSFEDRIRALAQTHTRLADANWTGVSLEDLLNDELEPYRGEDGRNFSAAGPPVMLNPRGAIVLGMAFHELATNAAKYGALSSKNGSVAAAWKTDADALTIHWIERDGPLVTPPERSGFGRLLLERALASDLRGRVEMEFAPRGLRCTIGVPLDQCRPWQ